jgi:EmrB/QacA subfamily drug resistance transporter
MIQIVEAHVMHLPDRSIRTNRWFVLAILVAAQFMYVVDTFIVNVAIPSIQADLHAGSAQIEAVIAIYQIGYAAMVITGGRLGDMFGVRRLFLIGLTGFTLTSLACGFAPSAAVLIVARLAQGFAAALMVPQVLASIHSLFPDEARGRAFAVYGTALGLGGAVGFMLGGWLVTLNAGGLGWRTIFFVNGPIGVALALAAFWAMPRQARSGRAQLDRWGALVLFMALALLIGPLLFGHDVGWPFWLFVVVAAGAGLLGCLPWIERTVERLGGSPLIELALVKDRAFVRGLGATFCFFLANVSFYFVVTLFMQTGMGLSALDAGVTVAPLALAFTVASRHAAKRKHAGISALIQGCAVQASGLAGLGLLAGFVDAPSMFDLMVPLTLFGYGQGLVMAQLFSIVLRSVDHAHAGSAAGVLATTQQIANAIGVAVAGAVYFAAAAHSPRVALIAALVTLGAALALCAAALEWIRRLELEAAEHRRLDPPLPMVGREHARGGARAAS